MTTISDTVPVPIIAGPEMEALARFHQDVTWDGGRRTAWFRSEGPLGVGPLALGAGLRRLRPSGPWMP